MQLSTSQLHLKTILDLYFEYKDQLSLRLRNWGENFLKIDSKDTEKQQKRIEKLRNKILVDGLSGLKLIDPVLDRKIWVWEAQILSKYKTLSAYSVYDKGLIDESPHKFAQGMLLWEQEQGQSLNSTIINSENELMPFSKTNLEISSALDCTTTYPNELLFFLFEKANFAKQIQSENNKRHFYKKISRHEKESIKINNFQLGIETVEVENCKNAHAKFLKNESEASRTRQEVLLSYLNANIEQEKLELECLESEIREREEIIDDKEVKIISIKNQMKQFL